MVSIGGRCAGPSSLNGSPVWREGENPHFRSLWLDESPLSCRLFFVRNDRNEWSGRFYSGCQISVHEHDVSTDASILKNRECLSSPPLPLGGEGRGEGDLLDRGRRVFGREGEKRSG